MSKSEKREVAEIDWSLLGQINEILASGDPVERTLGQGLNACATALEGGSFVIFLPDVADNRLSPAAAVGLDVESIQPFDGPAESLHTWSEREEKALFAHEPRLGQPGALCLPMVHRDTAFGILAAVPASGSANEETRSFLTAVACALATALATRMPHEDIMQRERLERELQFAHTLQRSFIPRSLPELKGYRLCSHHTSSIEMGGDFHDVIQLSDDRLAVAVGSTSGTGIEAGLNIARTLSELRGILSSDCTPGETLTILNTLLNREARSSLLVHIGLALLDISTGEVTCAAAGRTTLCSLSGDRSQVTHVEEKNTVPVGMIAEQDFVDWSTQIDPGGSLVIYTDGICQNENADGLSLDRGV
ncbi:MAG: PP2C family protein-serine/threonine phosphatase, partial [Planctomycetota bacterium]